MSRLLLFFLLAISVSSCKIWPYRSDFDCKIPDGEHCKSLYEINKMADQGKFDPNSPSFKYNDAICSQKCMKKNKEKKC
ncbi:MULTISPECIES: conjugal transfer protein TraV [unclassified Candidatus Tisiphia]|uniref:conjugal transfer protein TraV n=1 Tax=unclassified Candidatus Tisiphia TaxID=2996318 RepID=UPI00312C9EDF